MQRSLLVQCVSRRLQARSRKPGEGGGRPRRKALTRTHVPMEGKRRDLGGIAGCTASPESRSHSCLSARLGSFVSGRPASGTAPVERGIEHLGVRFLIRCDDTL